MADGVLSDKSMVSTLGECRVDLLSRTPGSAEFEFSGRNEEIRRRRRKRRNPRLFVLQEVRRERERERLRMSLAGMARPLLALRHLHLVAPNLTLQRHRCPAPLLAARSSGRNHVYFLCSLDGHATKPAAPTPLSLHALVPGGKHLSLTDQVYSYILRHTREPQILQELREEMAESPGSNMQIPPDQGQFLALLVQLIGAKRCIEVGVFHGYSSLAVALVLPEGGRLVACDRDERSLAVAREYYRRAGVLHKVDIRHALALDSLNDLLQNGEAGSYDYAFLDADKMMYREYYELLLQLVKPNGLIVVDNTLWYGRTADPLVNDKRTQFLREFNKFLAVDERISVSMVPIGDGMTLCRKQ